MLAHTRRPHPERSDCWHVFYCDVQVGTIAVQPGLPVGAPHWRWDCGFYPLSHRGQSRTGYAASFDQARANFEVAWKDYLPRCTEADFLEYRRQRDWTAQKYAMSERGERMPSQIPNSMMRCPCGARFDSHKPDESYPHRQHIYAKQHPMESAVEGPIPFAREVTIGGLAFPLRRAFARPQPAIGSAEKHPQEGNDRVVMPWSFKEQRRFIEIAAFVKSFDELVKRTGRQPKYIRAAALRLGVKLARQTASDNQLTAALKAKGK
jgi:hypothetical protein